MIPICQDTQSWCRYIYAYTKSCMSPYIRNQCENTCKCVNGQGENISCDFPLVVNHVCKDTESWCRYIYAYTKSCMSPYIRNQCEKTCKCVNGQGEFISCDC